MRKMITNKLGEFIPAEWAGKNTSGIRMLGEEVLILPDTVPETTKGGILLPTTTKDTHSLAAQTGIIVAVGTDAWTWNRSRTKQFTGRRPEPGDRVVFERYSGTQQVGLDGRMYFIMSDLSISGVFEDAEQEEAAHAA